MLSTHNHNYPRNNLNANDIYHHTKYPLSTSILSFKLINSADKLNNPSSSSRVEGNLSTFR
jgi:hypothetical protein